ncbi:SET and MYND domain-containing protein 4-like, partial [Contarinia nasturtii]|uniref:SET and MYND domain-containing protein 4-like n=1 Tax=Contarinia nasturtii TaxID=265458 RepID=UPI0012D42E7C
MENLWKEEVTECGVQYVDLFEKLAKSKELQLLFDMEVHSVPLSKNNQRSIELRNLGNEQFHLKNMSSAMDYYNQSLCFAEIGSKNVALAYVNRSACFFHIQKYREAIVDIELAESAFIPSHMLSELELRKQKCRDLIDTQRSENVPKLSYKSDENFPCVAECLELQHSKEFGRYFSAKCDIPVGKIVVAEESFIGARKINQSIGCCNCLQLNMNFIACQQCNAAVFCTKKCMQQNVTHKWECGT